MSAAKPKILLTGATGFVGAVVLRQLIEQGYQVMVLVRHPERLVVSSPALEVVTCALNDITPQVASVIAAFKPDAVIHSAWMGTENTDRNNTEFVLANLHSSLRLLEVTAAAGCKQWVAFGSQAEYSKNIDVDITETAPAYTDTAYGIAKLATCHMLHSLCAQQGISFAWLRIFASYGANYKASYVMPYLLECFREQEMPTLKTPHAVWDYIHVEDVAGAALAALRKPEVSGIFNLATGVGHSVGDIALMLAEIAGFKDIAGLQKHIDAVNDKPTRRVADVMKIKKELGWRADIALNNGLRMI